jgi:hypothetical protein
MKDKPKIDSYERKSVFAELKSFCVFADEHDFIEVTEWKNGEGFDVEMQGKLQERFQMTHGEFRALKTLVKKLNKE